METVERGTALQASSKNFVPGSKTLLECIVSMIRQLPKCNLIRIGSLHGDLRVVTNR